MVCNSIKITIEQPYSSFSLLYIGNAQSGASFESKTRFITKLLQNAFPSFPCGIELFYLTAPHRIQPADSVTIASTRAIPGEGEFDAWTWGFGDYTTEVMQGYGQTIRYVLEAIRTAGPFIGIIGFSAGATAAHTLVSLAERRVSPELIQKFEIDSEVCSFYILTPVCILKKAYTVSNDNTIHS